MNSYIPHIIAGFVFVLLMLVIILDIKKVINLTSHFVMYPLLAVLPIAFFIINLGLLLCGEGVLIFSFLKLSINYISTLKISSVTSSTVPTNLNTNLNNVINLNMLYIIFLLELGIFILYCIIKSNIKPVSFKKKINFDKNIKQIISSRKLLNYATVMSFIYQLITILYIVLNFMLISLGKEGLIFLIGASAMAWYLIVPLIITLVSLNVLALIFSLNGIIRLFIASKQIRTKIIVDFFLLLIPIINLIGLVHLCIVANKEIKRRKLEVENENIFIEQAVKI